MKQKFDTFGLALWVVAGTLVFPITFFVAMKAVDILGLGSAEDQIMWIVFIPLMLISHIGSQWVILRKYTDRAKTWLINTAMAWVSIIVLTFALVGIFFRNMTITNPSYLMIIQIVQAVVYGGIIGMFQAKALNGYAKSYLLIPANVLGIFLIWLSIGESVSSTLDMMLVGIFPALFTGLSLFIILKKKIKYHSNRLANLI